MKGKIEIKKQEIESPCHSIIMTLDVEWKRKEGFTNTDLENIRIILYDLICMDETDISQTVDLHKYTYTGSVDRDEILKCIGELHIERMIIEDKDISPDDKDAELGQISREIAKLMKLIQ